MICFCKIKFHFGINAGKKEPRAFFLKYSFINHILFKLTLTYFKNILFFFRFVVILFFLGSLPDTLKLKIGGFEND